MLGTEKLAANVQRLLPELLGARVLLHVSERRGLRLERRREQRMVVAEGGTEDPRGVAKRPFRLRFSLRSERLHATEREERFTDLPVLFTQGHAQRRDDLAIQSLGNSQPSFLLADERQHESRARNVRMLGS